jgi:hypothetical protein
MSGGFLGKLWNISGTVPVSVFIVNSFFLIKPQDPPPSLKWTGFANHTLLRFPAGAYQGREPDLHVLLPIGPLG